jgi:hypothetical protein
MQQQPYLADEANPCYALDENDPNYDSAEEPYKLKATQAFPRTDVIVAYKSAVQSMAGPHPIRLNQSTSINPLWLQPLRA